MFFVTYILYWDMNMHSRNVSLFSSLTSFCKMKFNFRYFLIFFKGYPRVTLSELVHFYVLRKLNNLFDKDIIIYFGYVKS